MTPARRSPPRGPAGDSDDPTLQEIGIDATGSVAVKDRIPAAAAEEPHRSVAERFTDWRRHYLPLPDEVVTEYLGDEEYVIHTDHPSFRAFLIKNLTQVAIATALLPIVFTFVRMDLEWWWILLIVLGLDLVLLVLAVRRLSDRYTSYVITNLRLIRVSGIIGRKLASIPWTRMTGLGFRQKPIGRLMGFATIFIESANEESGLREFSDINDPATFHQMILDMVSSKGGSKPAEPTKGVRKTLRQRRREAREAQRKQNEAAVAEAKATAEPATDEPAAKPTKVTDTAGPAEAMSTVDGGRTPKAPPTRARRPAKKPAPPVTPARGTPVVEAQPAPPTPPRRGDGQEAAPPPTPPRRSDDQDVAPPPTPPRRGDDQAPVPPPTPPRRSDGQNVAPPPAAPRRGDDQAPVPPPTPPRRSDDQDMAPPPTPRRRGDAQAPVPPQQPRLRSRPQASRPAGPAPGAPLTPSRQRLAAPRPNRPVGEPTGTPNRPTSWAWPGGPRQQRPGAGPKVPRRPSEPLGTRVKRAVAPLVDRVKALTRRPEPYLDDGTPVEKVSARDAIAAVRRGRGRPARRPRFPSFGRSKPAPPPSRQLPAGPNKPSDD